MNSNWRTPEEAKKLFCHRNDGPCISNACAYWLWRPCEACDTGTVINRDSNNLVHTKCQVCNGTGHDGSGLGRCGLIRGVKMAKVVCNMKHLCDESPNCGGAVPHEECDECGNCPRNRQAKCVPVCKHGNGQDCQQCQYERDAERVKGTGHEAWEVWNRHVCIDKELTTGIETCTKLRNPSTVHKSLLHTYQRRPDADEMIKEWEGGQKSPPALVVERYADNGSHSHYEVINKIDGSVLVEWVELQEADKCATCSYKEDIRYLLSFVPEWALNVPDGLDQTFYGTGSAHGDIEVRKMVLDIMRRHDYEKKEG